MFPSFLLSLREGLEAALIIGIVLGALRKFNQVNKSAIVWGGVFVAVVVSLVSGYVLYSIGVTLEGNAEKVFEGITMLLAAGVLTWMIFWMYHQARYIKSDLEAGIRRATGTKGRGALFSLAFLAVFREGVELSLFLTASTYATNSQQTFNGAVLGLGTSILLGWSLFSTTVRLDLRRFFQVTGVLLIMFAAGLVAHGVHEFNELGWVPRIIEPVWDLNPFLDENSFIGQILKSLFGYNSNPSLTELFAYVVYLTTIAFVLRRNQIQVLTRQEA